MSPLISIIIPTFNRCSFLGETLNSIIGQHYQNWECLIVDDGSTDYTDELASFYCKIDERINFFKRPERYKKGANSCRNYGFELSKGDYINWFDDDDIMLPNFLSERIDYMNESIEIIICSFFPTDAFLNRKTATELKKDFSLFRSYALYELKLITNSVLFRRDILQNKELYKPGLEYGDETEFFLRIFDQDPEPSHVILNKPLFLYRQHTFTKSEENKVPSPAFRYSIIYVGLQNFNRGVDKNDRELRNFYYKKLVALFFRSLETNQNGNAAYLLQKIVPVIKKSNKTAGREFFFWGKLFLIFGRGSYKIEQRLKRLLN